MEIAFATIMLREICESEVLADQKLGGELAACLKSRLADLRAVDKISQLPIGNPKLILKEDGEYIDIELDHENTLSICANHTKNPCLENGGINWDIIYYIKVCRIGDYCD